MTTRIIPAIMSGGSGTRLWPASTDAKPKQFHALSGPGSLIAETISRVQGDVGELSFAPPIILGNAAHTALVEAELHSIKSEPYAIVLEPAPRNTAAAAAVAAQVAIECEPDALVLLLPADHVITDVDGFHAAIRRAAPFARERIVTFGITPDRPEVGYGYIRRGDALGDGVFEIGEFKEKPKKDVAQTYLDHGGYSWNAGMFFFAPTLLLQEFAPVASIRDHALASLKNAKRSGKHIYLNAEDFAQAPSQPLDIAVMEKTRHAAVAPSEFGWADVGSWDEIWRLAKHDGSGNALFGAAAAVDSKNNLLRSDGPKICVAGVEDLIVVATPDAVMILPRSRAQDAKLLRELAIKLDEKPSE